MQGRGRHVFSLHPLPAFCILFSDAGGQKFLWNSARRCATVRVIEMTVRAWPRNEALAGGVMHHWSLGVASQTDG